MNEPKANFSFWPLSGKKPLEVHFVNQSQNLGGYDEWSSCLLNQKYHISNLNSLSDIFALDFSEWSEEGIKQTYNENGFKLESTGAYYYNINENENPIKERSLESSINIDLEKDFHIEFTIVEFKNYHGSIQLYFEQLPVNNSGNITYNDIGIHINTNDGEGNIRYINNLGTINLAVLKNYNLPVKIKFIKVDRNLKLYIDDTIIYNSSSYVGVGKKINGDFYNNRNLVCPLKFKVKTQNNVSNWSMHIKDIYIVNNTIKLGDDSYRGNLVNYGLGFSALYNWDFGDGDTSTDKTPIHVFNTQGPKNISLQVTTENGIDIVSKNIIIYSDNNELPNAGDIFREKNEEVVRDLDSIPDYCSNERLKNIINASIYDAIRHTDTILDNVTIQMKLTLDQSNNNARNIKCETSYINLYKNENTSSEHVVRTLVETEKQNDLVNIEFELEDPE